MRRLFSIGLLAVFAFASSSTDVRGDLVAYWNFNDQGLPGGGFGFLADPDDFPLAADLGAGSITVGGGIFGETEVNSNGDTVYRWIQSFAGNTGNALGGDPAGGTISLQGGTDQANNGGFMQFAFDMTNLMDLVVSYDSRGTASGFTTHTWSWSNDGVNFTDFQTVGGRNVTTFSTIILGTLSNLDNVSTAFLRVTVDGATGSTGNNRFDNIQLNAAVIPEPGSFLILAITGLAGLSARRRR